MILPNNQQRPFGRLSSLAGEKKKEGQVYNLYVMNVKLRIMAVDNEIKLYSKLLIIMIISTTSQ